MTNATATLDRARRTQTWAGLLCLGLAMFAILGCGEDPYEGQLWSEPALAAIGGSVLATEGNMQLVQQSYRPPPSLMDLMTDFLSPISVAHADTDSANACAVIDPTTDNTANPNFSCEADGTLRVFYDNCIFPDRDSSQRGYWRTYSRITLPDWNTCNDLLKASPITFQDASLVGTTVGRYFGLTRPGSGGGDESNYRLSPNGSLVYLHTFYPSGWHNNQVQGGMEITFDQSGSDPVRRMVIKGLHAVEYSLDEETLMAVTGGNTLADLERARAFSITTDSFDTEGGHISVRSDDTMDSATMGSTGSGAEQADNWDEDITTYDPIVVTGSGASKTLTSFKIRTQHNVKSVVTVAKSLPSELITRFNDNGLEIDSRPVSWTNDATCCWPTQGEYLTNYYHTDKFPKSFKSALTRFTSTCGRVLIRYYSEINAQSGLNEDEPKEHQLTQCY